MSFPCPSFRHRKLQEVPQRTCATKILPNFLVRFASKPLFYWVGVLELFRTFFGTVHAIFWLWGSFSTPDSLPCFLEFFFLLLTRISLFFLLPFPLFSRDFRGLGWIKNPCSFECFRSLLPRKGKEGQGLEFLQGLELSAKLVAPFTFLRSRAAAAISASFFGRSFTGSFRNENAEFTQSLLCSLFTT